MAEEEQGCLAGSGACALIAHQPLSYGQREAARGWLTTLFRVGMFLLGAIGIAGHADLAVGVGQGRGRLCGPALVLPGEQE